MTGVGRVDSFKMPPTNSQPKSSFKNNDRHGYNSQLLTPENAKRSDNNHITQSLPSEQLAEKQGENADLAAGKRKGDDGYIRPARKFTKYIEYDFSKIKDSRGGFLVDDEECKGRKKWDEKLNRPIIDPHLSLDPTENAKCRECGSVELDFSYQRDFDCNVCYKCIKALPEKYSLLTKTECRTDYLLTESELKDTEVLPHRLKPNPHASNWSNMMLYVRYQAEAFAIKKWGSLEKLDEIYTERESKKKLAKDKKFMTKLQDLKKRTMTSTWSRLSKEEKHEHIFGQPFVNPNTLVTQRKCETCDLVTEEIEF